MEENMESNDKEKKKKNIIDPTERKRMQAVNEIDFIINSESENNCDDDTNDADDEGSVELGGGGKKYQT